jgi:cytosine/adenosine deaminase-related metal-dependent hydrolase
VIVHAAPWVVPISGPPLPDAAVALDGDRIAAVGPLASLAPLGEVVEHGGVLMPGLINAHLHLELSHLRIVGGDGLVPWIRSLMATRAQSTGDGNGDEAATAAALAMAARGTVAAVDISNDGRSAPQLAAAGIAPRMLRERIGPRGADPSWNSAEDTAHATYSCNAEALRALAGTRGLASIHVEEDPAEAALLVDGDGPFAELLRERGGQPSKATAPGMRPIAWLDSLGVLGEGTLLVHLTVADAPSLQLAAARGCIAVLCPRSNQHIGKRLPDVAAIRAAGLRVALGTDSLASCATLDVLGDVQLLARAGVDPAWLLRAATDGGAAAFGAQGLGARGLGSLGVGKCPGLVALGDDARGLRDPEAWVAHEGADAPARRVA